MSIRIPDVLARCMTRGGRENPPGCGMSLRPFFYSGRGAILGDLDGTILERIYQCIKANEGSDFPKGAAEEYVRMVAALPKISATDFLETLEALHLNGWKWADSLLRGHGVLGVSMDGCPSPDAGIFGIFGALMGDNERDDSNAIRGQFLRSHGMENSMRGDYGHKHRIVGDDLWGYTHYGKCYDDDE